MKYKRGRTVEVFCNQSWRCARIVSSKGHMYTVSYDVYPGFTNEDDVERVSVKSIRPCPPLLEVSESWVLRDVAEVFHNLSWKMAVVVNDCGWGQFVVRLVGFSQVFEVNKSELRVRQSYQNGEWIVIGKVPSDHKDANSHKLLKHDQDLHKMVGTNRIYRNKYVNRTSGDESSSGSCSINSYKFYETHRGPDFVEDSEDHESDAESVCKHGYQSQRRSQSQCQSQSQEIHRLELVAYRDTMTALHASGPLTWEKETMGQSIDLHTLLLHQ